jgi:ABC-2 type transport system ATP-binding protein
MLSLIDVTVRRGATVVVERLSVRVRPGAVWWVTGPNGAGKSSLLRVMAGLDRPAGGRVERREDPDHPFLYFHPEMANPDTVTVGDWERLVRRLLPPGCDGGPTPLWPTAEAGRRVGRLSTGERKRLLLDALLRRPGSLLLDEPFEHLSPRAKADLSRLLEERSTSSVVVVATNQATERAVRDGGIHLESGVAVPLGSRQEAWS